MKSGDPAEPLTNIHTCGLILYLSTQRTQKEARFRRLPSVDTLTHAFQRDSKTHLRKIWDHSTSER